MSSLTRGCSLPVFTANVLQSLRKNKDITVTKSNKENEAVILDRKFYDNDFQEVILDISKFKKLIEDPTLKREASLQSFLRKLKQKKNFEENEYSSGSAPVRIYGTPKMHKFSPSN